MSPSRDSISVLIDNKKVSAQEISVVKTIQNICDTFSITLPTSKEKLPDLNKEIRISIGDTPLMVGYVNTINHASPANDGTISIAGRSKSQDIVDSRITFTDQDTNLSEISQALFAKFNQKFTTKKQTDTIDNFAIVAQSAFQSLSSIAKQQNLFFIESADGSVQLVSPGDVDNSHIILSSKDLSNFQVDEDLSKKFATIKVKTNPTTENLSTIENQAVSAQAVDDTVRAARVQEFIADSSLKTEQACKDRVNEIINTNAALSLSASGVSPNFTQNSGAVWNINEIYTIANTKMLLDSVTFLQTGGDRTSALRFKGFKHE